MADELEARAVKALEALAGAPPVTVTLGKLEAWILFSNVQLALRHPANRGPSADRAVAAARKLQALFAGDPVLSAVAEMGWDERHDAPPARRCRVCGCTDDRACIDDDGEACYWVKEDLCSACADTTKGWRGC